MKLMPSGRICLSILLSVAMFIPFSQPGNARSRSTDARINALQTAFPEQIEAERRGWEKLSPDLRARLEAHGPAEANTLLLDEAAAEPLLVSALTQPGLDAQVYFSRSVRSRVVGGFQWITGHIQVKELGKLASLPGVAGIISTDTYETTEAPELDELRFHRAMLSNEETRALLLKGEVDVLRQRVDQREAVIQARLAEVNADQKENPAAGSLPGLNPTAANTTLREIHDVKRAHALGYEGAGVVVGVVDSGVDFANPDLQGTQALIKGGPYAGWPFSYDTISGVMYAMNAAETVGPDNYWRRAGWTQYAHTLPVQDPTCEAATCMASLVLVSDGVSAEFRWPNTSKSGKYYYTVHPDLSLAYKAYYREINYPEGWLLPPPVIVVDETQAGVYDAVYIDTNYNHTLEPSERVSRAQPLSGSDVTEDGTWDMSGGMLGWISDGTHHPPGVSVLYPEVGNRPPPAAGRLLVFINDADGHGTSCASEIAGQGKITDPTAEGPANPRFAGGQSAGGVGGEVISSMAPSAKIAAFQNGANLPFDSWTLAVLGMDGISGSGDEVQILSNSWGDSRTIEDGWDPVSRFAQRISYEIAPEISILVATGNGGPGYGTVTAPNGGSIIDVGASTAYGAVRGFEDVNPSQFLYGDIQPWSNRGPGGLGDIAPDVAAVGAWGTGAVPLNRILGSGQTAYDVFGGTSMSTPVAAGTLALVYQAYLEKYGSWPDADQAREFLLAGARDLSSDVFTQGAGNVRAARSIEVATGRAPTVSPVQWQVGDYHDKQYPAFPSVTYAGETSTQSFYITNPATEEAVLTARGTIFQNVGDQTFSFAYSNPPPESERTLPIFLKDLTPLIDQYEPDMIRAQVVFPYSTFDMDEDAYADSWWDVALYDWKDTNQNGRLWTDKNRDGRVNDDEIEIDPTTGLYEYNRFSYASPQGDAIEASLGGVSLGQRHDGVFLGLRCQFCGHSTTLQVRVTFYQKIDWPWLNVSLPSDRIAPAGESTLDASLTVPPDALPGAYEGAIELVANGEQFTIPVVAHVAARGETFRFGGQSALETPYDNSHIFGGFNWQWRYESGDWRFFYFDIPEGASGPGKAMLVDTRWNSGKTDIDTWILGPEADADNPAFYGPQGMQLTGGSEDSYTLSGQFLWKTNSQGAREIVRAPVKEGLGIVAMHNVLNGGTQLAEGFSGKAFQVAVEPGEVVIPAVPDAEALPLLSGSASVTLETTGDIEEGVQIYAYGMDAPVDLSDQPITQNTSYNICSASWFYRKELQGLEINHGGLLEITTTAEDPNLDIDVFLFQDDGDDTWMCGRETPKASSMNAGAEESIKVKFPEDGHYWILVHGYDVPGGKGKFDINIRAIDGTDLTLQNMPLGPILAGRPATFTVNYQGAYPTDTPQTLEGLLMIGTPSDLAMLEIPIHARPEILLYPEPALTADPLFIRQSPSTLRLVFRNLGTLAETVTARIDLPAGLEYQPGTADGPGADPVYDPVARALIWTGPAAEGEQVEITFKVTAQPGFRPGKIEIPARVTGHTSGQVWQVRAPVWLNLYGVLFPQIQH